MGRLCKQEVLTQQKTIMMRFAGAAAALLCQCDKPHARNAHERQHFRDMNIASPFAHMLHSFGETAAAADKGKRVSLKSRLGARLALNNK